MATSPLTTRVGPTSARPAHGAGRAGALVTPAEAAFLAMLEPVIVDDPVEFPFDGSIKRQHVHRLWAWVRRDLVPDVEQRVDAAIAEGLKPGAALEAVIPDVLARLKAAQAGAANDLDLDRRLTVQVGGEDVRERLSVLASALRCRALIEKARAFGRAANALHDDASLAAALQSMPLKEPAIAALLMHTIVGQVGAPNRLVVAAQSVSGGGREDSLRHAGFAPLVDALLAHAQNQLSIISAGSGAFGDIDLVCRAIDRFHRLIRAVGSYVELDRNSPWTRIIAQLIKLASGRIEPRLREVSGDVSQSMRKPREGADRADAGRLLAALNGLYLLAAVRDARDSLALNTLFEKTWTETGQLLEVLLTRNLDEFRGNPANGAAAERLEQGLKMAEIRFNTEYADILRKARDAVGRRSATA